MIQDAEAEDLCGRGQLFVYAMIGFAGLEFPGWMIVGKNYGSGAVGAQGG